VDELGPLIDTLTRGIEALEPLREERAPTPFEEAEIHRQQILWTLRLKIGPEIRTRGELPVIVGVQGGTNVGKSTIFNALAGNILSPTVVTASATKHPLIYAHERWRRALLEPSTYPDLELRELTDPKELLAEPDAVYRVYFRFHASDEWSDWAFIDSPDFDSVLDSNLRAARLVSAMSDVTVFVTTGQKYKDRDLVAELGRLIAAKASVVLVFNFLDEEIVFSTLLEDLRAVVGIPREHFLAVRVPRIHGGCPENEIRPLLLPTVAAHLGASGSRARKPELLRSTIARTVDRVDELRSFYETELELKALFRDVAARTTAEARKRYVDRFRLALPEETLAKRFLLERTEIGRWLPKADRDVIGARGPLGAVASALGRASLFVRRLLLRLAPSGDGSVVESPGAIAEYAKARDETDFQTVSHLALETRQRLETFLRTHESAHVLAREALVTAFSPEAHTAFPSTLRSAWDAEVEARRDRAENVYRQVDAWFSKRSLSSQLAGVGAMAFKLLAGFGTVWLLPPSDGFPWGVLNLFSWIEFVAGYLCAAYVVAVIISLSLRRSERFRRARVEALEATLTSAVTAPLEATLDQLLSADELRRIANATSKLRSIVREEPSPEKARVGASRP
jgi:hypothetical protein